MAGSLIVVGLDLLLFVVSLGGSISGIGCFAIGAFISGVIWCVEIWRSQQEETLWLKRSEWEASGEVSAETTS